MTVTDIDVLRIDVQRLMGRCILRMQHYEHMLKVILGHHEIAGPPEAWPAIRTERIDNVAGQTLGNLVSRLLGSFFVASGSTAENASPTIADSAHVEFRVRIELSTDDHNRMRDDLKDLTSLRNHLVHHFVSGHDLGSIEGCRNAKNVLETASAHVDRHLESLHGWVMHLQEAQQSASAFVQSDTFRELFVNGISPDGSVSWADAGIVRSLRLAATHLAVEGWTSLSRAADWIRAREPEQTPEKYGCRTWRHVVHESGVFELCKRVENGRREAWYRDRGTGPR